MLEIVNSPESEALAEETAQAAHGFVQRQVVQSCETRYRLRRDRSYRHEFLEMATKASALVRSECA